jgi:ABC-type uncharacterized transport system permease subunit
MLAARRPLCKQEEAMTTALVHIALTAYVAAAVLFLVWLVRPQRLAAPDAKSMLVSTGRAMLLVGVVLHLASFAAARAQGGIAAAGLGSDEWKGGQLFSLLAAFTVVGYLILDFRYKLPVAGAFVAPFTVAVMVPAHLVHTGARQIAPSLTHSAALALHVGAAALGSAALGLAFALSLLYLLGEKQIKTKHPGRLFSRLPSLDLIDRAGWRLSVWGFVFLSIAIATGSLVSKESTGASFPLQPKEGFAVLAWALLAGLIQARLVAGWRGRRVALLVVAGFLLLVGTYAGLFAAPPQSSTVSMLLPGGEG